MPDSHTADSQTSNMMDLFSDIVQRAPVNVGKQTMEKGDVLNTDISAIMAEKGALLEADHQGQAVQDNIRETIRKYKENHGREVMEQVLMTRDPNILGRSSVQHAGDVTRRNIIAAMWLLGASWSRIASVLNRRRETAAALGRKALMDNNARGLPRKELADQDQVELMWNYANACPDISQVRRPVALAYIVRELNDQLDAWNKG